MIPVGAIVGAALAARRFGKNQPRQKTSPELQNVLARLILLFPMSVVLGATPYVRWITIPFFVCAILPATTLRFLLIPLGLPRVAYYFARTSPPITTSSEIKGAAVLFASLALLRTKTVDPDTVSWLSAQLDDVPNLRAAGLAGAGFLAVARGRTDQARLLLASSNAIAPRFVPRVVRRPVQSWLVADAARRGDWTAVGGLARHGWQRWPRAMALYAKRLLAEPGAPSDLTLRLAWLVAPHRRASLPILRRALAVPRARVAPPEPELVIPSGTDALDRALAAHARFVRAPARATVEEAGRAWDVARAAASSPHLSRRALALETSPDPALARVFATAETDLAPFVDLAPAAKSPMLEAAAAGARRGVLDDVETTVKALRDRTQREVVLDDVDEWAEWTALRVMCERARGDGSSLERRRTVFSIVYPTACNHAVWLFNTLGKKLLANTIFRWLGDEALLVADDRVKTLLKKNIAAGSG